MLSHITSANIYSDIEMEVWNNSADCCAIPDTYRYPHYDPALVSHYNYLNHISLDQKALDNITEECNNISYSSTQSNNLPQRLRPVYLTQARSALC